MGERTQRAPRAPRAAATAERGDGRAEPRPETRPTPRSRHYAALDLGTNNCRLLIARPQGDRASGGFAVVDAFSRIVRLGEGLGATGRLSDAAIGRTLAALQICAEKLKRRNVLIARSVATEACRRAENGAEFIERVYAETGIALDIKGAGNVIAQDPLPGKSAKDTRVLLRFSDENP